MRRRLALAGIVSAGAVLAIALATLSGPSPGPASAASHREAPLISLDPTADITDFFLFRSYEEDAGGNLVNGDKVELIMDVIPGEEPSSGPNYWNFDPGVTYTLNVDNNADGKADDVRFEVTFENEIRGPVKDLGLFLSYIGNVPPADGSVVPPITALDGPGSEGIGVRQRYTVKMIHGGGVQTEVLGSGLIAVPSNVGPRTMPDYDALAAQGIHDLGHGMRVFAGQRDDPFYIDLGAVFDTLNLRSPGTDMLSGFNVHTIALELPVAMLTKDGLGPDETAFPKIGAYASTSRAKVAVRSGGTSAARVQVQRLANPLVNEAIIGTVDKDRWNAAEPEQEAQFEQYYTNLRFATALQLVFGAEASPLLNVRDLLLKYNPADTQLSELLRLDTSVDPVALDDQERLTVLAGDNAGWPNGRRPTDDVTDIVVKVIGGTNFANAGDGVDANDKALPAAFPFVASPWDGRNRVHENP